MVCALPILSFIGSMAALYGGGLVAWFYGGMGPAIYIARLHESVSDTHFEVGIIKAPFMALVIGIVACSEGLRVKGSAESLGKQTTTSVVKSIFLVSCSTGCLRYSSHRSECRMQDVGRQFAIRVRDLVVGFRSHVVIDHLALDVCRGEILGLVGASGGGKSVLMRTIIGLIPRQEGEIEVMGAPIGGNLHGRTRTACPRTRQSRNELFRLPCALPRRRGRAMHLVPHSRRHRMRTSTGAPLARATAVTPFHQSLTSQNCMACHTDHSNPALTPRSRPAFSHGLLNTAIRENCTSCHAAPATLFIAARQPNAPSVIARIAGSQPHSITQNSSCWTEIIRRLHHLPYDRRSSAIHLLRLP